MTTPPSPTPAPSPEPPQPQPPARTESAPTPSSTPEPPSTPAPPSRTPPATPQPPDWNYSGIDPKLMHDFERDLGQAETTLRRSEPHIRHLLLSLNLDISRLSAIRELGNWIAAKRPELRRRNDTIQAVTTQWGTDTTGGLRPFDEVLYTRSSGDPDAYAAASKLAEVTRRGPVDEKVLAELEKRAGNEQFATNLMYALGTEKFRHLITALAYPKDPDKKRLQAALGKALGAASTRLDASWRKELLSTLRIPTDQHGLAHLLKHGTFDRDFLVSVAVKLEALDRETWGDRVSATLDDPMVSVWAALARHPRAAQDFLISDPSVMRRYLTERQLDDNGEAFADALHAATTTYRDRDGTPQERSPGFHSAKLAKQFIDIQGQLLQEGKTPLVATGPIAGILAAYANDISRIGRQAAVGTSDVYTATRRHLLPQDQVWGAQFDREKLRAVMTDLFQRDPKAMATVTAAQTAWAKQMLDYGAAQAAAGKGYDALRANLREAAAGFGMITDAGGLAEIHKAKDLDAAQERNMKLLLAAVNTALNIPQATPWAIAAGVLGSWSSVIEDSATTDKHTLKATHNANTAKEQTQKLVDQLAIDTMLKHGLFGKSDPPDPNHPWSSLEGLKEGDDPRKSPNNFLKNDGKSLMTPEEMEPYEGDVHDRSNAYESWLRDGAGETWKDLKNQLNLGVDEGMSEFKP